MALFAKNKKITLIERNLLQKIAGELQLQASGAIDETSTQKMGKLLGAEAVLTGTLNDVSDKEVEINARVLIVQTAKIVSAEKMTVKKTWKDSLFPGNTAFPNTVALISRLNGSEKYVFKTANLKSGKVQRTYFKDKTVIALEIIGNNGALLKRTGKLPDGFYSEYYDDGTLKTEKILIKSREYGPLKTYFPGGALQNEAYYTSGKLDGTVKIYSENGKPLFEQDFRNGVPDGYLKEYDVTGGVKSETFYKAGHIAPSPAESAAAKSITVKSIKLARGSEFNFYEENKYLCKILLDNELSVLSQTGECPGGIVRAYSKEGKLEKEFIFTDNKFSALKVFNEDGNVTAEKSYVAKN